MSCSLTMDDFNFKDKVALVRIDINSSIDPETKKILDDTRIRSHAETIIDLSEKGAKVVILAHQGRPGDPDFTTLEEHAKMLSRIIKKPVRYVDDIFGEKAKKAIRSLKSGEILVLENVRMFPGEMDKKTPEEHAATDFVKNLASLADFYIDDAFAAAHRSQASLVGFTVVLPSAAGRVMERELKALNRVRSAKEKPCIYLLGGAKAEDAAAISEYVLGQETADYVMTGGVIGNLFLYANGCNLGKPNIDYLEKEGLIQFVPKIQGLLKRFDGKIMMPVDVAVSVEGRRKTLSIEDLPSNYPIYDIGPKTVREYAELLNKAKIIVLSGPMGVYENKMFLLGTEKIFKTIARSKAFSVAGGGHTIAALEQLGVAKDISYISTGGGALMEFLMGKTLPAVAALEKATIRA